MIRHQIKVGSRVKSKWGPMSYGRAIAYDHGNAWVIQWDDGRIGTRMIWGLELVVNGVDLMLEVLDDA
jgi:hypothetical protein